MESNLLKNFKKSEIETAFSRTLTENGDDAFSTTGNNLTDILFMSEYYTHNLDKVSIGDSDLEKLFSMFVRDPRFGIGMRDLGRVLMDMSGCNPDEILFAGRFDDLYLMPTMKKENIERLFNECKNGNELAKKWMPRYSSKNMLIARTFAKILGMNKQQYGKFVKANTVENMMSRNNFENIEFEHVPSLASIKYAKAFDRHQHNRYMQYLEGVKSGEKKLNVSVTNVFDIYRNRNRIDADLFYSKMDRISISCVPVIDVSGSMFDHYNSIGKALSIGKYLSDCSNYCPGQYVTFSECPSLLTQNGDNYNEIMENILGSNWGCNTDFGKVMEIFSEMREDFPDYIVVLSDMQFDCGSRKTKDDVMRNMKCMGAQTKIIWWNFNTKTTCAPETDRYGNIFMSGYSPMLLSYLSMEFDSNKFLEKLLSEYYETVKLSSNTSITL